MKDGWLKAAFKDDNMVANLLLHLVQSSPPPPPPLLPPVSWGQKQARSTPSKKQYSNTSSSTRCSPTTPLSWTTTHSDNDSDPFSPSRSKNFSQLKEEETELLKGRVNSKRVHVNLKEQRNKSDNLKRIKLDLNQQSTEADRLSSEPEVTWAKRRRQMEASIANLHQSILPRHAIREELALTKSYGMQEVAETNKRGFFVPDLNIPVGDDGISAELW